MIHIRISSLPVQLGGDYLGRRVASRRNVTHGMLRRMAEPTPLRRLRCPSIAKRALASMRSIVAALTSRSLALMTGSRSRWPCRSMASISFGINAFRRLPQTRSAASHNTVSAWRTASSYRLVVQPVALARPLPRRAAPAAAGWRACGDTAQLQCCDQLLTCRHADLPCHLVSLPPDNPAGGKLREATGQRELHF
ncbi:hypothetical protein OKW30_003574 [Paraburkholderia sp. Clong3]